uniref:USP domain-containing protein n=1 Tax=Podarcis muralis TaxID=64176 RepID=A0A670K600_PODMU
MVYRKQKQQQVAFAAMDFAPEKKEAFIVTREICAGRKKIPLGSIGCFVEGKHSKGRIVDMKSRPVIALMSSSHIRPLSRHQAALLLTIESPQKRHSLFCNEQLFSSICCLRIHDVLQLRYGRVATVGIVRGFWERRRKPGSGELRMVLIEVELLDPGIIALGNSSSRLKIDASKIVAVSSSITNPVWCKEIGQRSLKKAGSYIMEHLAEHDAEAAWEHDVLQKMEGVMKGIQGHCNSCYLDTTLYSLFSFSSALDGILYSSEVRDATVQQILRQQIVQPLRQHGYVGAENVMNLRRSLRCDSFVTEEKDPEEFLNVLLREVLAVEPLLKIRSDNEVLEYNCYQILAEKDATIQVPTVQQLLEKSLLSYGLKLDEVPSCLILQMPRFGKSYKKFSSVYPSLELDLTDMVEQAPRVCCVCGGEAAHGCSRCQLDSLLHPKLIKLFENLSKPPSHRIGPKHPYKGLGPNSPPTKQYTLDLFAVLCIESSHYVAFVKYGPLRHSWLFFDSMAGTLENEKGTNIPVVKACPQIGDYLAMTPEEFATVDTNQMDAFSRRFFCDAYTFMYQKPQHASYKYWFRN